MCIKYNLCIQNIHSYRKAIVALLYTEIYLASCSKWQNNIISGNIIINYSDHCKTKGDS